MPDSNDASNAALETYNTAVAYLDSATAALAKIQQSDRPATVSLASGYGTDDSAGKQWDKNYQAAKDAVTAAQTQAATASRQYATIIEQQSSEAAKANTPAALAQAERGHAMAEWYQAQADGYAAKAQNDTKRADAAQQRGAAALQRANTAASRVDSQNNASDAQAALARATAAKEAATTPTAIAAAQAQIDKANNDIALANAKLPGEIAGTAATTAHTVAQTDLTNAQAGTADANTQLLELQAKQLQENDPLVKAHLQAQTANLNKPSLEQGYQNASQIPMIVKDSDGQWTVQWVPNQGQQMTSTAALTQLGETIGLHLGDGPNQIPVQTAKDLFSIANDTYKTQTDRQVANNQGATVGAGLLNTRVNAVNSQENTLLGLAGGKNFGLGGPLPTGLWQGVHNEVLGNATQAGGGQSTYDTAMALVHQAAPHLQGTPAGAGATGVVQQMLDAQNKPAQPASAPAPSSSFQAPTTTITPDGTVTIQHAAPQDFAAASVNDPSRGPGFQAPYAQSGARRIQ